MFDDAFTVIGRELQKLEGPKNQTGDAIVVCCPFHNERSPSCSVNMSTEKEVRVGTWYCFGCQRSGSWNKLAEHAGLEQIKEWQNIEARTDGSMVRFDKKKAEQIGTHNLTIQRLFDEVGNAVLPWPKNATWRSYSGKLINRVEGYVYDDIRFDELMLVLPVYINGRYRGGVRALREKPKKGPSYFNTTGDWSKDYGLLGFDYMRKKKLYGCKAIVLTEGPRDWLRMVENKIPAVSILGSAMFSKKKLMLLMGLGIEKIYAFPDNDKAGYKMAALIEEVCEGNIPFEFLRLPRKKGEDGKIIELDPDNAPQKFIDKVKAIAYEHQVKPEPEKKSKKSEKTKRKAK